MNKDKIQEVLDLLDDHYDQIREKISLYDLVELTKAKEILDDAVLDEVVKETLLESVNKEDADKRFGNKIFADVVVNGEKVIPNKQQKPHSLAAAYVDIDRRLNDLNETVLDHDERIYGLETGKTEEDEFPF